ncbi:unnamed protein product [Lactuca virosa]|uniref:Protein kinase domain-containing protein n=1 Tax=Lactuca virosa TaxID=75947 RepID=A0AAU9NG36_9ASTR|nr:unnamed protein product [Lactuca virosa]
MKPFQLLHLLVLIMLAITLIEAQFYSQPPCSYKCGDVSIEYPFGIGKNCSANEWYRVDCDASTPYLPALNNAELLYTGYNTVTVNMSLIKADCKNPVKNSSLFLSTSDGKSPFQVSRSRNMFRYKGCGLLAIMDDGVVVSGCSTTCGEDAVSDLDSCFGNRCCQTTIPDYLQSFIFNLTEFERQNGCGSAFLVDADYERRFLSQLVVGDHTFVPISLSWNEIFSTTSPDEEETCGDVRIPYPFGIKKNSSRAEWFNVVCNSSTPYLPALNNVEVLVVNASQGTVTVNVPRFSDCEKISFFLGSRTSLKFSAIHSIFVFEGCGSAALMLEEWSDYIITGCSTTCDNNTVSDIQNCFGIGCCQATIPDFFSSAPFTIKRKYLERQAGDQNCGSAFVIDKNSFIEGRFSRQFVPVTLSWRASFDLYDKECVICRDNGGFCYHDANANSGIRCFVDFGSVKKLHNGVILGVSISMGSLFLIGIGYALYKLIKKTKVSRRKRRCFKRNGGLLLKQQEESDISLVDKTILFTSNELEKATDNFNENRILGRGAQGTVYKGMLVDGRIVAIKKSKVIDESQLEQFINEVVILSQVNHRNVVKLLGCCLETNVPLLVSEFISNGTLYDLIHDETGEFSISFNMRLQIATDVAGAVSYLHSATSIPIYHRDIKTTNILLDEKYQAKVSDFGTSRFVSLEQTHLTTLVKGTFGYLDPEYFQSSQFTEKSDVYSFGVVLLELLTSEKPISLTRFGENRSLATHFLLAMEEGRVMSIFDAMIVKEGSRTELLAVANLAMRCLNINGKNRPTMKEVTIELEGIKRSHVPSMVETNIGHVKHCEEVQLSYGESTSTSMTFDYNPRQ